MLNRVILIGNLGADPEVRYLPNGSPVANVTVATSRKWKDKATGEKRDATEWHRIIFFNRLAEIAGEYLKKGSQVYLEGRLQTRKWQDNEGHDRYTTEIIAEAMHMLGGKGESAANRNFGGSTQDSQKSQHSTQPIAPDYDDFDDDIPL